VKIILAEAADRASDRDTAHRLCAELVAAGVADAWRICSVVGARSQAATSTAGDERNANLVSLVDDHCVLRALSQLLCFQVVCGHCDAWLAFQRFSVMNSK